MAMARVGANMPGHFSFFFRCSIVGMGCLVICVGVGVGFLLSFFQFAFFGEGGGGLENEYC